MRTRKNLLRIRELLLLGLIAILLCLPTFEIRAAVDTSIPNELTDLDKIHLMMAIQEEYPPFLKNGVAYGFNPFEVLEDQIRLMSQLSQLPQYVHAMRTRPNLLEITIQDREARALKSISIDPNQLNEWRQSLLDTYHEYPNYNREIVATINRLNKRNPDAMLSAEILKLSDGVKKEAFRQGSFKAKLAFLKNSPDVPLEIKNDLPQIEEAEALQAKLEQLTELSLILQSEDGSVVGQEQALQRLSQLSEKELIHLLDYNHFVKPGLDALNVDLEKLQHHTAVRANVTASISARAKARMSVTVEKVEQAVKNEIHLVELRPLAGVFRACSGGDCSTKYSFAAPNNPDELVFNIMGADGKSKGYLEATRVMAKGKASLYVSCINGPKISKNDAEMILQALYEQRQNLHFENLLLPKVSNLGSLVNYENIIEVMRASAQSELVPITHSNPEIRGIIESFKSRYLTMKYDSMKNNAEARMYKPGGSGDLAELSVSIQSKATKPIVIDENRSLSKIINFVIENSYIQNSAKITNRALKALGISDEEWLAFQKLLKNEAHLSTDDFQKQMEETYRKLAKDSTASLQGLDSWILAPGYLNAPDALSADHAEASLKYLFSLQAKRKDLFEAFCYTHLAGMFGEKEPTPGARLVFEKIFASDNPALQEIARRALGRFPNWPGEAFAAFPKLFLSMVYSEHRMLTNLQQQGGLSEAGWKEILSALKPGDPKLASLLLFESNWPKEVWPLIPDLVSATNLPERQSYLAFLRYSKSWPDSFWKEIPRLLLELPWGARMDLIRLFNSHGPIPKDFIEAVPGFQEKLEFRVRDLLLQELKVHSDNCEKLYDELK